MKYCFADASLDYMHFLGESRKAEEERKAGQAKAAPKARAAAATVPPTKQDELIKQLGYQQHQIDALVGQVNNLVSAVRPHKPPPVWLGQETLPLGERFWEADPRHMERGL